MSLAGASSLASCWTARKSRNAPILFQPGKSRCQRRSRGGMTSGPLLVLQWTWFDRPAASKVNLMKAQRGGRATKPLLALALGVGLVTAASAETVRLANEPGGSIAGHIAKYQQLAARGVMVELSGTCTSACTMVTGIIP